MSELTADRRELLKASLTSVTAGLAMLTTPSFLFADQAADEELVPFLNMPRSGPNRLDWETLDQWLTPQDQVFNVQHYGVPSIDLPNYKLEVTGLVERPRSLNLDEIKSLPRTDQLMTLECSGNGSSPGFINAIYNSRWTGTPLWPLLESCGVRESVVEAAFIGHDEKEESLREGTPRALKVQVPFGRSMSLADVRAMNLLLAYERNGEPLDQRNGAPLRLIVPGWYGIANVKWLRRIELRDRRYMGRYMGRDYVTVRGERNGDQVVFVETSVTRMNLKSIIARVLRRPTVNGQVPLRVYGAVWSDGTAVDRVEVQVDGGDWQTAKLDAEPQEKYCWRFFSLDVGPLAPGKHMLVSRGIDVQGRIQPAAADDEIALKKTYWEAYQQWPREIQLEA